MATRVQSKGRSSHAGEHKRTANHESLYSVLSLHKIENIQINSQPHSSLRKFSRKSWRNDWSEFKVIWFSMPVYQLPHRISIVEVIERIHHRRWTKQQSAGSLWKEDLRKICIKPIVPNHQETKKAIINDTLFLPGSSAAPSSMRFKVYLVLETLVYWSSFPHDSLAPDGGSVPCPLKVWLSYATLCGVHTK